MGNVTLWMQASADGFVGWRTKQPDGWHVFFGGADPVALGGGTPLFGALDHRLGLELTGTRTFDPGVAQLRYRYSAGDTRL